MPSGRRARGRAHARRRDRVRACRRLVRVRKVPVLRALRLLELGCLGGRDLRVEEREDDLLADLLAELLEHHVALARGTRRADPSARTSAGGCPRACSPSTRGARASATSTICRITNRSSSRMIGRSCSSAPKRSSRCLYSSMRVVDELVDELVAVEPDLVAQLLGRDVRAVEVLHRQHERVEVPLLRVLGREELVDRPLDRPRGSTRARPRERSSPSSTRRRCS